MWLSRRPKLPFSAQHCQNLVYKSDWETAICIKSITDYEKQRSLFAIRAFNVVILTSIEKVSKPVFAEARINFLKTGLNNIYKKEPIPDHPILQELKYTIEKDKLPKAWLNRLITERTKDDRLGKKAFMKYSELERYHELTTGTIWLLSLMAVGVKDVNCDVAAKHAARCIGVANALRAQPLMQTREILVPLEFSPKHEVNLRDFVEKKNNANIENMIFDIATLANANLTKVQSMRSKIPVEAHDIFRQLNPTEDYLKNLENANFNLFDPSLSQKNNLLAFNIMKLKWKQTF